MEKNKPLELAMNFVQYTDKNIFLTGKAGTGKTTFLHNLKKSSPKRMAVVAPTGVAAINAGGVTINSFFQFPFGPYIPGAATQNGQKRFNRDKINLLKSLDLLVIDEISMVRADTIDQIDDVLRKYRGNTKPFGGIQLLMIGDLHQLSPVIKEDEWRILKDYYPNLYFFSSKALQSTSPLSVELTKIYRQSDNDFIDLLNHVRKNEITSAILSRLNERYIPDFIPSDDEGYITLTTHNLSAQKINEEKLESLRSSSHLFRADVLNDFPEYSYPTVAELELKIGAQVMFVKNDPNREKLFYNGKIGIVTKIDSMSIFVKCPDDYAEIEVGKLEWSNIKYELNPVTKEVDEKIIGSFTQYPLKLAWAITIHKSQGLTFERAIIDASLAFAHGQVYVALSRCKSFEGMVLRSPISFNSVKTDGTVSEYTRAASSNPPGDEQLFIARVNFQQTLLMDLFDFSVLKAQIFHLKKVLQDHYKIMDPYLYPGFGELNDIIDKKVYQVSENFRKQLSRLMAFEVIPEEDLPVMERVKKGCEYFSETLDDLIFLKLEKFNFDTDNKVVRETILEKLALIRKETNIKKSLLKLSSEKFSTLAYLQAKADCEIEFEKSKKPINPVSDFKTPANISHPELYESIRKWRNDLAIEKSIPPYHILAQKSLLELIDLLPQNLRELQLVKGIGKLKASSFGMDILEMINNYCLKAGISRNHEIEVKTAPSLKTDTQRVSLDLFKSGKRIPEIAVSRGLTTGTIENHLTRFILNGELSVLEIVSESKVTKISSYLKHNPEANSAQAKEELGSEISYTEIRAVKNHLIYSSISY